MDEANRHNAVIYKEMTPLSKSGKPIRRILIRVQKNCAFAVVSFVDISAPPEECIALLMELLHPIHQALWGIALPKEICSVCVFPSDGNRLLYYFLALVHE